jgi:hypothetical protein
VCRFELDLSTLTHHQRSAHHSFNLEFLPSSVNMFYNTLFLVMSLTGYSEAFFRMSCPGRLVRERLDPIISPGKIAGHVHSISGGSAFSADMTYNDTRAAKCSSCQIKVS